MNKNLTIKQEKVYMIIKEFIEEKGYSPSIREIMSIMNLTSPATIHSHIEKLVDKGYITYTPGKFRTIRIEK